MSEKELKKIKPLLVRCTNCNEQFALTNNLNGANGINPKIEFTCKEEGRENKKLYLTYYVCPKCGKKYFVQIDDDMSLRAFKTVSKNLVKLAKLKQSGRGTRKQQLKFNKQRRNLEAYRNKLKTYYVGKTVYDKRTDENFILVLSV